jgi:hypothetical protein
MCVCESVCVCVWDCELAHRWPALYSVRVHVCTCVCESLSLSVSLSVCVSVCLRAQPGGCKGGWNGVYSRG